MISRTYGRVIERLEGAAPVELALQYRAAKVQAMSLLSASSELDLEREQGGPTGPIFNFSTKEVGPTGAKMPRQKRRKNAD
jgi:hypothetical protein